MARSQFLDFSEVVQGLNGVSVTQSAASQLAGPTMLPSIEGGLYCGDWQISVGRYKMVSL